MSRPPFSQQVSDELLSDFQTFARRDDWHHKLDASDVRMIIADLFRLRAQWEALPDGPEHAHPRAETRAATEP